MVDENSVVDRNSIKLVDESSVVVKNTGLKLEEVDEKTVVYQSVFSQKPASFRVIQYQTFINQFSENNLSSTGDFKFIM